MIVATKSYIKQLLLSEKPIKACLLWFVEFGILLLKQTKHGLSVTKRCFWLAIWTADPPNPFNRVWRSVHPRSCSVIMQMTTQKLTWHNAASFVWLSADIYILRQSVLFLVSFARTELWNFTGDFAAFSDEETVMEGWSGRFFSRLDGGEFAAL